MTLRSRRAGVSAPLFALRSSRSWGIGEIGDIPAMASWLRSAHQSVLQILPLNELPGQETSPYSALSAMAIDPQFVSLWMVADAALLEQVLADEIEAVRRTVRVDYPRVRSLKERALRAVFDKFFKTEWLQNTDTAALFQAFIERESWWLDEYSVYRALRTESGERPWMEWPAVLRDRDTSALAEARTRLSKEMLFRQYVQWLAADQWQAARRGADGVEIVGDFPFMVALDSADVWSRRQDFILDASLGTPPDAFSDVGQDWGLPPYNWDAASKNDYEWLRLRARRQADLYEGFRVDHLVGFYRTYVRPLDGRAPYFVPATEDEQRALGETLMRILIGSGADVSVEDLGSVPNFVRESITSLGLPGYRVLRWEAADPMMYPFNSVAMTGTHDTETLAVWWDALSVEERRRLGSEALVFDARARDGVLFRVYNAGSALVVLPIQDIFGWRDRINQPATVSEANWTFVLPWPIDRMGEQAEARERADWLTSVGYQTGRWNPPAEADD